MGAVAPANLPGTCTGRGGLLLEQGLPRH
jgi:hypothetical protein